MAQLTVGIIGMVMVLTAYTLNQLGRLDEEHVVYDALNFIGALLLLAYAFAIEGWPFLFLNLVWGAVAGYGLYMRFRPEPAAEEHPREKKPGPSREPPADEELELTGRGP